MREARARKERTLPMWAKLDDALLDHRKILEAARLFGKDGRAKALGYYAAGLLYANKHLTNGFISDAVIDELRARSAARVMTEVGLWEATEGGVRIHDFHDFNLDATDVLAKRQRDRERKKKGGQNRHGNGHNG
jgi:hypothetical protein